MDSDLLFANFSAANPDLWKKQILREIKAATDAEKEIIFDQKFRWRTLEGIVVEPFYTASDVLSVQPGPLRERAGWCSREEIEVEATESATRQAAEALAGGIDEVSFTLSPANSVQLDALLSGLSPRRPVRLLRNDSLLDAWGQGATALDWLNRPTAPEAPLYDQLAGLIREDRLSKERTLVINSQPLHNAGASATQELAFTLAAFVDCTDKLTDRGLGVDAILKSTEFSLAADTSYFLQIAKFRALRVLIGQIGEAYGVVKATSSIHACTARWNKFRQDAYNNVLRATLEAMAAVLGGCDTLTVEPYNRRFGPADGLSRRIARNVHAILREESYLDKVADPAAGAYFVENATYALAAQAWQLFQSVEGQGGYWSARRNGFIREEIGKVREQKEAAVRAGAQVLVGINKYLPQGGESLPEEVFDPLPVDY